MLNSEKKKIKNIKKVKRPVVRPCPCAVGHISCNYINISHILGCPFNCSYCFLHTFYGKDEIVVYDNEEDILAQLSDYLKSAKQPLRVGTGQYSDSLALDKKTGFSKKLIEFFAAQDQHLLELKTKSAEVDHLLRLDHKGKTIFAWSVNPEKIVKSDEEGSVSLSERIEAAKSCCAAGYPVAFHFDPIIYYPGWEKDYQGVVELIFKNIDHKNIAWISLGALRSPKKRYPIELRVEMFRKMQELIRQQSKDVYLYLCMESQEVWDEVKVENQKDNRYFNYFKFFEKEKS
jgi:DNA repair photolyase